MLPVISLVFLFRYEGSNRHSSCIVDAPRWILGILALDHVSTLAKPHHCDASNINTKYYLSGRKSLGYVYQVVESHSFGITDDRSDDRWSSGQLTCMRKHRQFFKGSSIIPVLESIYNVFLVNSKWYRPLVFIWNLHLPFQMTARSKFTYG